MLNQGFIVTLRIMLKKTYKHEVLENYNINDWNSVFLNWWKPLLQ